MPHLNTPVVKDHESVQDLLAWLRSQRFALAQSLADELLATATAAQRPALEACRQLASWLGPALSGEGETGLPQAIASVTLLEREGYGPDLAWTCSAVGFCMGLLGNVETGLQWIERAIAGARRRRAHADLCSALGDKAAVLTLFGSYDRALRVHAEVAEVALGLPGHNWPTERNNHASCCILAARELAADDPRRPELAAQALGLARLALKDLGPPPWTWQHGWSLCNQGHALRLLQRPAEAEAAYAEALTLADVRGRYLCDAASNLAALLTDCGRHEEAQRWLDIAMAQVDASLLDRTLDLILETQARLHASAGRVQEAMASSEQRYHRLQQRYQLRVNNTLSDEALRELEQAQHAERQALEQSQVMQAASVAKTEFLAHMSHEIRTPIHAILGLAQLLDAEPLAPRLAEQVGGILEAGDSLLRVVDDILDISKIEAGQLRTESIPFPVSEVFQRVDRLLRPRAKAKGLDMVMDATALDGLWLAGDPHRIEQVLVNLIGNAIKFTEHGRVDILATKRDLAGGQIELQALVSDTGIGIAPEVMAQLFKPFVQAHSGVARQFGGTGLGLAICRSIIEHLGGRIGSSSEMGAGSQFWFELALARSEPGLAPPCAEAPRRDGQPRLRGLRVLAVDDNRINQLVVRRLLEREGALVRMGQHGGEALDLLAAEPAGFDIVLMDMQMPVMDGLQATRAIRADARWASLPVLALTASTMAQDLAAAEAAGVTGHMAKPIKLERLVAALLEYVPPQGSSPSPPG